MFPVIHASAHTDLRSNRTTPRWFVLPVVREVPAPPAQVGSAW
jgi:hypothetical protein